MIKDINNIVMAYDKGMEYKGTTYATIYDYREVNDSIQWSSNNRDLLVQINREVFNFRADVIQWKENEELYILSIDKTKIK